MDRGPLLSALLLGLVSLGAARPSEPIEFGRRLFTGELLLTARMVGHAAALPAQAVRCENCHRDPASKAPKLPDDGSFGPTLGRAALSRPTPRRGGPASSYDLKAFCAVLSDGIDPAHVMISQAMPRYTLTPQECEALWAFVTRQ